MDICGGRRVLEIVEKIVKKKKGKGFFDFKKIPILLFFSSSFFFFFFA